MSASRDGEQLSSAERRLDEHLTVLRDAPEPPASLTDRVIHGVRWQRAVRSPLHAMAQLAGAALDAIRLLVGEGKS